MSDLAPNDIASTGHPAPIRSKTHQADDRGRGLPFRTSENIQGNILAGFRKDRQTLLFLTLPDSQAQCRAWLESLLPRIATTKNVAAFNERFSAARHQRGGDDPKSLKAVWINLGLTFAGLAKLEPKVGQDLQALANPAVDLPEQDPERIGFPAFTEGPAARAQLLHDVGQSVPENWVVGGIDQNIDAILTVAADDQDDLITELEKQRALATRHGLVTIFEQRGATLAGSRAGHEHFGFKDGISQPGVRGFDVPEPGKEDEVAGHPGSDILAVGEFILGYKRQGIETKNGDGEEPGDDTPKSTAPRPHLPWMKDGSFQVFRRLVQDVPGFWGTVTERVHSTPFADPPTEDLLSAKLVGRWRSGTPLDTAPDADNRSTRDPRDDNNFKFENDAVGERCPRFAHIRKMYPRDSGAFGNERRRIIRRGIPFGLPFDPASGRGHGVDAERGLLFIAFMSSIEDQFEFLQKSWANNAGFPPDGSPHGPDPIIGDADRPSNIKVKLPDQGEQTFDFPRFVHTSGAVYAFAPSLETLTKLAIGGL